MFPRRRPENGEVFSVRTAPIGGIRGQNRSVFDENRLVGTARKKKFNIVFRSKSFLSVRSVTDKNWSPTDEMAPNLPKTAILRAPGTHGTPNRVHWVLI